MITQPGRDPRSHLLQRAGPGQLHAVGVRAQTHVIVAIDETRQHKPAVRVDHLGTRRHVITSIRIRADPNDPAAADRHSLGPRTRPVHRIHPRMADHQIGRRPACHAITSLPDLATHSAASLQATPDRRRGAALVPGDPGHRPRLRRHLVPGHRTSAVTPAQTGASPVDRRAAARTGRPQRVGGPGDDASDAPSSQMAGRHTTGAETSRAMTINDVTVVSVPASDQDRARPSAPAPSASSSPATTTKSPGSARSPRPPARCKGWSYAPMTSTRLPAAARRRRTVRRTTPAQPRATEAVIHDPGGNMIVLQQARQSHPGRHAALAGQIHLHRTRRGHPDNQQGA